MTILLLALLACDKGPAVDSASGPDDSASDSADVERYGPENRWYHAPVDLVPEAPDAERVRVGAQLPELMMTDQFGDQVSLYQFAGRLVVLDIAAAWCGPCHDYAPFVEAFHERQGDDGVIVITVILQDVQSGPAGADTVADWVEAHAPSGPTVFLDADAQRLLDDAVSSYPNLMVIDPEMRIVTKNANDLPESWWQRVFQRVEMGVGGNLDDAEICGDGVDNDLDFFGDCMDSDCEGHERCAVQEQEGELGNCMPVWEGGYADTWRAEVQTGTRLVLDTVAAETRSDLILYGKRPEQDWSEAFAYGDDEWDCSFPLDEFGCPDTWLAPGTWDLAVFVGTGGDDLDGSCGDPSRAGYVLRSEGELTLTLQEEDVTGRF